MIGGLGDYDRWKLATPPEYEWPEDQCEDCGGWLVVFGHRQPCTCNDDPEYPHPDDLAAYIDEGAQHLTEGDQRHE